MLNKHKIFFCLLFLAFVGVACYINTLNNTFVFDDTTFIQKNLSLTTLNPKLLWNSAPRRIVAMYSFGLNYKFGKLNPIGYHLTNIIIHVLVSFTILWLVKLLQNTQQEQNKSILLPFIVSLLFLTHPIQTEAVTYISQRMAVLAALFFLLAVVFYIKSIISTISTQKHHFLNIYYLISILFFLLALLTKENTFILPLVLLMLDLIFIHTKQLNVKKIFLRILPFFIIAASIYVIYLYLPDPLVHISKGLPQVSLEVPISRKEYILTQLNVMLTYIRLLFLPIRQNLDYDYPITHSLLNIKTLFSLLFILTLTISALYLRKKNRFLSFGIFFFFLTLIVESSIIPLQDVIFEHRLYLPSVGFFISIVFLINAYYPFITKHLPSLQKIWLKGGVVIFISSVVLILSFATISRNLIWRNDLTLWSDTVQKSPLKSRPHSNVGYAYAKRGLFSNANKELEKAIALNPTNDSAFMNLGNVYLLEGNRERAKNLYKKAISINPYNIIAIYNLAALNIETKNLKEAAENYQSIIKLKSDEIEAYNMLGIISAIQNDTQNAQKYFNVALKIEPEFTPAKDNLYKLQKLNKQD